MTITFTSKLLEDLLTIINNPLAIQPIVQFILQFIVDLIPFLLTFYLGRLSMKKKRKSLTVSREAVEGLEDEFKKPEEDLPEDTRTKDRCIDTLVSRLSECFKVTKVEKDIPVDDEYTMSMIRFVDKKDIARFTLWKDNIPVGNIDVLGEVVDKAIKLNCYKEEILDVTISKLKSFAQKNQEK